MSPSSSSPLQRGTAPTTGDVREKRAMEEAVPYSVPAAIPLTWKEILLSNREGPVSVLNSSPEAAVRELSLPGPL